MRAEGCGTGRARQGSRKRRRAVQDELVPGARSRDVGAGGMVREGKEK